MATKIGSQDTANQLESKSEFTCSVCLEQLKDPKVLPCCHTFCKQCLQPLVKRRDSTDPLPANSTSIQPVQDQPEYSEEVVYEEEEELPQSLSEHSLEDESSESETLPEDTSSFEGVTIKPTGITLGYLPGQTLYLSVSSDMLLSCPQCRAEHQVPENGVDGFQTDFSLARDLEVAAVVKAKEEKPSCGQCESSDPSVAYCVECEAFLCQFCSSAHKRMKSYKEHNDLPIDKVSSDTLKPSVKPVKCTEHPGEEIRLYCRTCQELICRECTLVDHRSHNFDFMNQERQSFQKKLQRVVERSKENISVYEEELQIMNKVERYLQNAPDDAKKQIAAAFDACMSALQSRREALLAQVDSEYQADSKKVWAHKEFTETAIADITSSLCFAERASKCSNDADMISLTKQAIQRLESLNTREHKLNSTYEVVDNTASYSCSHIEEQLHTCDSVVRQQPSLQLKKTGNPYLGKKATFFITLSNCNSIRFNEEEVVPTITIEYGHSRKQFSEFVVTKIGEGRWTVTMECICGGNHYVSVSLLQFSSNNKIITVNGVPSVKDRVRPGPDDHSGATGQGTIQSISLRQQSQIRRSYQQQLPSWLEIQVTWDNGRSGQYRWGTGNGDSTLQYAIELVPTPPKISFLSSLSFSHIN